MSVRATIDIGEQLRHARSLSRSMSDRMLGHIDNELGAYGREAVEHARRTKSKRGFKASRGSTGILEQGLWHGRVAKLHGGRLYQDFGWSMPHGRVLEFGPSVMQWEIKPKWRKALRWFQAMGGSSRSGGTTEEVLYAKKVTHVWKPSHKRPHLVPALEETAPLLDRRIEKALQREWSRWRSRHG